MNKIKYLIAGVLLIVGTLNIKAASTSMTIAAAGMSNVVSLINGGAVITQVILTSPANNTSSVRFYDAATNPPVWINPAYIGTTSYATNLITSWTNFFGSVNYMTNVALVDITNTVAAVTNTYPIRLQMTAPTNGSFAVQGVNYNFNNGIWVTNLGSGTATITVTYQQ